MTAEIIRWLEDLERRLHQLEALEGGITAGSWIPIFVGTGTAGTFTYTANGQVGRYTRFGNLVSVQGLVEISAISVAPTGALQIGGLPFAASNVTNLFGGAMIFFCDNLNMTAGIVQLTGYIAANTSLIVLAELFDNAAGGNFPATGINTNSRVIVSALYQVG